MITHDHPYQAVLVDLDGTLVGADNKISTRTCEVIHALQEKKIRVMPVTGRAVTGACKPLKDLDLETPICCYNGSVIFDIKTDTTLQEVLLDNTTARTVLEMLTDSVLEFFVYHKEDRYTLAPKSDDYARVLLMMSNVKEVSALEAIPASELTRISYYGDEEPALAMVAALERACSGKVYLEHIPIQSFPAFGDFSGHFCDVQPYCAGKAEAVHFMQKHYDIPAQAMIAIGDQANDIPMFREAGLSCAVANAAPAAKAAASRVIGHFAEDGVAVFLADLFDL